MNASEPPPMRRLLHLLEATPAWQAPGFDMAAMLNQLTPQDRAEADTIMDHIATDLALGLIEDGLRHWARTETRT